MNEAMLIPALALGAAGSLHCAGMCGPLCLLLPLSKESRAKKIAFITLYQFGRVFTYASIGLLLGSVGHRFFIAGYQQWFSIVLGSLALLFALLYFYGNKTLETGMLKKYYAAVQRLILKAVKRAGTYQGSFLFGMANGLLPCGMVYMATLASLSFHTISESTIFMAMFGAGTIPVMFLTTYAGQAFKRQTQVTLRKMIPAFILLTGCILILRGLNLGIPFLSPHFSQGAEAVVNCHP